MRDEEKVSSLPHQRLVDSGGDLRVDSSRRGSESRCGKDSGEDTGVDGLSTPLQVRRAPGSSPAPVIKCLYVSLVGLGHGGEVGTKETCGGKSSRTSLAYVLRGTERDRFCGNLLCYVERCRGGGGSTCPVRESESDSSCVWGDSSGLTRSPCRTRRDESVSPRPLPNTGVFGVTIGVTQTPRVGGTSYRVCP